MLPPLTPSPGLPACRTPPQPTGLPCRPYDSSTEERKVSTDHSPPRPLLANVESHHLQRVEAGEDCSAGNWYHKWLLLPNHSPPLEQLPALHLRYAQPSQRGKQKYVLDGPAAAPEPYGTLPPHTAPLPDPTGMPEWDDASCAHQMRPSHSYPSRVSQPMSMVASPPPQRQTRARPKPRVLPQGTLRALRQIQHDVDGYQLFVQACFAPLVGLVDERVLQLSPRPPANAVQAVYPLATRSNHRSPRSPG